MYFTIRLQLLYNKTDLIEKKPKTKISRHVSVKCFYEVMADYGVVGDVKNLKACRERGAGRRRGCPCQVTGGTAARWVRAQTHVDEIDSTLLRYPPCALLTVLLLYLHKFFENSLSIYNCLIVHNKLAINTTQRNVLRKWDNVVLMNETSCAIILVMDYLLSRNWNA